MDVKGLSGHAGGGGRVHRPGSHQKTDITRQNSSFSHKTQIRSVIRTKVRETWNTESDSVQHV